jgi:undecaprenyl pyrophosphate synthase
MRGMPNNQNILRTQLVPQGTDEASEEKAKKIAGFSQYVLSREAWFRSANELVAAMELLEPNVRNFWECVGIGAVGAPVV